MKAARIILPPTVALLGAVLLWEIVVRVSGIAPTMLPGPLRVWQAFLESQAPLWRAAWISAQAAIAGFLLAGFLGVIAAIFLSSSRLVERAFYPFTIFLQTVPLVAIAPLVLVWCGPGKLPVIVLALVVSIFPVIANTLIGLRSVDPALLDMFKLYGASPLARLFKLKLPSALPSIFTGLRIAAGLAVIGTIVGESVASFIGNDAGLGMIVLGSSRVARTDYLFAAVVMASLLGLVLFGTVNLTGYLLLRRWHASAQERE